jgi:superfamily I DNA/RNA helicase
MALKGQDDLKLVQGSCQQEAIWEFLRDGSQHGLVDARAGTGKTFTIVQGVRRLPRSLRVGVFSFNRHIVEEQNRQLRQLGIVRARATTFHSFGFQALRKVFNRVELIQDKLWSIIRHHTNDRDAGAAVRRLVSLCKNLLDDGLDPLKLDELVVRHSIEMDYRYRDDIFELVPRVLADCLNYRAGIDFDDMIWLPVKLQLPVEKFDLLLVDEAQDCNVTQQALLRMACPDGRIVIVGDRFQSVYGFRGADVDAIPSMQQALSETKRGCQVLPLTVTRRSPLLHVEMAQVIVPDIEALPDAPNGEVLNVGKKGATLLMKPGDMGVCRVNRELVPAALKLIQRGTRVIVRGREIGTGLISLIDNLKACDVPDLLRRLEKYWHRESVKWHALGERGASTLAELEDRVGCLIALCEGVHDLDELKVKIRGLFADVEDEDSRDDFVLLGTIHRTKGLEANKVFVLAPELIPHPAAKQAWEREQERNLAYIAATRAKFEPGRHPGRLIFVGSIPDIYRH